MSKNKVKALHNGRGFTGELPSEIDYERVKSGKADWRPNVKARMTHVTVPAEVFYRLMELDKAVGGESESSDL